MSIRTVITRGYGNGTYSGSIGELVTRGFTQDSAAVAPTVDAGGPYEGNERNPIQLAADITPGSDPSPTIAWSVQSGPSGTFSDASVEDPTFTPNEDGTYTLLLTVTPSDTSAVTDTATLTALNIDGGSSKRKKLGPKPPYRRDEARERIYAKVTPEPEPEVSEEPVPAPGYVPDATDYAIRAELERLGMATEAGRLRTETEALKAGIVPEETVNQDEALLLLLMAA